MVKTAFVFPGQGAQAVGMGKYIFENYPEVQELFLQADEILNFKITDLMFNGPEEKLSLTRWTQIAMFVVNAGYYFVNKKKYGKPDFVLGHSLGEYNAVFASEALDFVDTLKLVDKRAEYINQASKENPGIMAAIIGLTRDKVEMICSKSKDYGIVEAVNFNSPEQTVISGEKKAVEKVCENALKEGAKKSIVLNVSGPFHSSLMKSAKEKFAIEIEKYNFNDPSIPIITNYNAKICTTKDDLKIALINQISNPVLWEDSIRNLFNQNVENFIECGPDNTLTRLIKRILR